MVGQASKEELEQGFGSDALGYHNNRARKAI
jgi:hypothetical protein